MTEPRRNFPRLRLVFDSFSADHAEAVLLYDSGKACRERQIYAYLWKSGPNAVSLVEQEAQQIINDLYAAGPQTRSSEPGDKFIGRKGEIH